MLFYRLCSTLETRAKHMLQARASDDAERCCKCDQVSQHAQSAWMAHPLRKTQLDRTVFMGGDFFQAGMFLFAKAV